MNNFYFNNPTKVYFGRRMIENLASIVSDHINILVAYGKSSAKTNGLYDEIRVQLHNKNVVFLNNVEPNPTLEKIYEGIHLCKKYNVDLVIGVGGGSVCDSAKLIAAGATMQSFDEIWNALIIKRVHSDSIASGMIITAPGSGTEMSDSVVITNSETREKRNTGGCQFFPKFCIIDPEYTYTLPKQQMAFGCVDTFVHLCESYFSEPTENNMTDYLIEAAMKCLIDNINMYLSNPDDYNARSNIMWCSTMAMNGILKCCKRGDWFSHALEHEISGEYPNIAHGEGLAAIYPNYLRFLADRGYRKLVQFAENVYGFTSGNDSKNVNDAIDMVEDLFRNLGCKSKLNNIDIERITSRMENIIYNFPDIDTDDTRNIVKNCIV